MKRELPPPDAVPVDRLFADPPPVTDPAETRAALERLARTLRAARLAQQTDDAADNAA